MSSETWSDNDLCKCQAHRCCDGIDPGTGKQGVRQSARQRRAHERQDRQAQLQARLQDQESAALRQAEEELTQAVANITLEELPAEATREIRASQKGTNAMDRISLLVKEYSTVIDISDQHTTRLQHILDSLRLTKISNVDIESIRSELSICNEEYLNLVIRLDGFKNRSKDGSVLATRDTAATHVGILKETLMDCESQCQAVVDARQLEEEARRTSGIRQYNTEALFNSRIGGLKPVIQLVLTMVVACHVLLGLPRRGCDWLLSMAHYMVETVITYIFQDRPPPYFQSLLHSFPHDLDAAIGTFNINTKETIYAVCPNPRCHATYKPDCADKIPVYPLRCKFRKYKKGSRCGQLLVRQKRIGKKTVNVPIKTYITFDLDHWIAGLLSRPGYEKAMDNAWERMTSRKDGLITDVFQGSVVREFMGPTKTIHFSKSGGEDAGRYLFSLGFDFFNPRRNLRGGGSISIGAISLVCLNLPMDIRYKVENIFLAGIVPGPKEPPLDTINWYLEPIVTALLLFWSPGVWFTKTTEHVLGRLILCAIILIVCDLPAARKIGGFLSHSAQRFCTVCHCDRAFKSTHCPNDVGLNSYDVGAWHPRTSQNWRRSAKKFLNCGSDDARRDSANRTGVRWSELLRLPYYHPSQFLVVDPMHNLFLGLVHEHFRNIFGYDSKKAQTTSNPQSRPSRPQPGFTANLLNGCPGRLPILSLKDAPSTQPSLTQAQAAGVEKLKEFVQAPVAGRTKEQLTQKYGRSLLGALIYIGQGLGCMSQDLTLDGYKVEQDLSRKKAMTKGEAAQILADWRFANALPGDLLAFGVSGVGNGSSDTTGDGFEINPANDCTEEPNSSRSKRGQVFTQDEMEAIWQDLEDIVTPSWVASVQQTFLVSGPSLKSDQWRMVGSLYLPLTLTRLWAKTDERDPQSLRRREYLELTMSLASAVIIAASRITSTEHANQYMYHMIQYRRKLRELFPDYIAHPNHHMAMHLSQFMEMYGPVHGWWTFPNERMYGMLQRISTNHKLDENGESIARAWHRSVAFRAAIFKIEDSAFVTGISHLFQRLTRTTSRNSLAQDNDSECCDEYESISDLRTFGHVAKEIQPAHRKALQARVGGISPFLKAKQAAYVRHKGKTYSVFTRHGGNSNVLTQRHDIPTRIEGIFQIEGLKDIWLTVRRRRTANLVVDPFMKYPFLRTQLWSREFETELEAIPLSEVDTHYAALDMEWEQMDVTSVSWLSPELYIEVAN